MVVPVVEAVARLMHPHIQDAICQDTRQQLLFSKEKKKKVLSGHG